MTAAEELIRRGWQKQATYDEPRLTEMVTLYEAIGFEVHLEPLDPETEPGCSRCLLPDSERYKTIYTHKKG